MVSSAALLPLICLLSVSASASSAHHGRLHLKHEDRALISTPAGRACKHLSASLRVSYALSVNYLEETQHEYSNAADTPTCVVEPDTPEQVGEILKVVARFRAPFAVQSGGHTTNPGFSSTKGVHITLSRFNHVTLSPDRLFVDVGSGQTWGDVYKRLENTGRIVVGGRVASAGVGGFLAYGGGYSFLSNQYGLGVDLIEEYTLVLSNGTVKEVTTTSDNSLFNALKGSGNKFGIITSFKLRTVLAPDQVWGGQIVYSEDKFAQLSSIIAEFTSNNQDSKAAILPSFTGIVADAVTLLVIQFFYDGPAPPPSTFAKFLEVPALNKDVKTRGYLDLIQATPAGVLGNLRSYFHPVPVRSYSAALVKAFADIASEWTIKGVLQTGLTIAATVEPFTGGAFAASTGKEAFLHDAEHACLPSLIGVTWLSPLSDDFWESAGKEMVNKLTNAAKQEGQDLSNCPYYPNYSLFSTPSENIYLDQLPALQALRMRIDPTNVMSLAGGFKV